MRKFRVGRLLVPLWLMAIIIFATVGSVFAYLFFSLNVNVVVQEPLNVSYYDHDLSLYPGQTEQFDIEIFDSASSNYTVTLGFRLNNSTYQSAYATFSNDTYIIVPGDQTLQPWIRIAGDAPAANVTLSVDLSRMSYPSG